MRQNAENHRAPTHELSAISPHGQEQPFIENDTEVVRASEHSLTVAMNAFQM